MCRRDYPLNLCQGLDYTRYPDGYSIHPHPAMIGAIPTLGALFDAPVVLGTNRAVGFGQNRNVLLTDTAPNFGQVTWPQMPKLRG